MPPTIAALQNPVFINLFAVAKTFIPEEHAVEIDAA